ncbi:MAG: hypothetical protein ACPHE0_07070, partial [Pseudomonadales bacterium]
AVERRKKWVLKVCCDRISSLKRREENQRARVPWQAVFRLELEKNPAGIQRKFDRTATRNSNKKQQKSNRPRRPDRPEIMPRNDAD